MVPLRLLLSCLGGPLVYRSDLRLWWPDAVMPVGRSGCTRTVYAIVWSASGSLR